MVTAGCGRHIEPPQPRRRVQRSSQSHAVSFFLDSTCREMVVGNRRATFRETASTPHTGELPVSLGRHVIEACTAPMVIFEASASSCTIRYANPAFVRRTGYSAAEIEQIGWDHFHLGRGRMRGMAQVRAAIRQRRELQIALRIRSKDGAILAAVLHVSPIGTPGAHPASYAVGVLREPAADPEYVSRLEHDAHCDPLTGLPNRRLLADRADLAISRALRERRLLGIALVDLDRFKTLNDTLGHAAGDEVLCAVGARLARHVRPGDLVARVGGDEFVLLLKEANSYFSLASIVERLRRRVEQPIRLNGHLLTVRCSIGVAVCPADGRELDTLLKHADRAMYRQKEMRYQPAPAPAG